MWVRSHVGPLARSDLGVVPLLIWQALHDVKKIMTLRVNASQGSRGPLWQHQFWDRFVRHQKELNERLDYMHLNPVRKRLVKRFPRWEVKPGVARLREISYTDKCQRTMSAHAALGDKGDPADRLYLWLRGGTCRFERRRRPCRGGSNRNAVSICAYRCQNPRSLDGACEGNRADGWNAPQGGSARCCFQAGVRQRAEERQVAKWPA